MQAMRQLALPHAENKQLQLYVLDFPEGKGFLQEKGPIQSRDRPTHSISNNEALHSTSPSPLGWIIPCFKAGFLKASSLCASYR